MTERQPVFGASSGLRTHLDVVCDDGNVSEVEGGIDLVHDVQRRGLVVMQRKHQRQRAERLRMRVVV